MMNMKRCGKIAKRTNNMNENVEFITSSDKNKPKQILSHSVAYFAGAVSGLLSVLMLWASFGVYSSGEIFSRDFFVSFSMAIVLGIISFVCFSPWKRFNFLISGSLLLLSGVWIFISLFGYYIGPFNQEDFGLSVIWTVGLLLGGFSLLLRFFKTTLFNSIHKISQTKIVRRIAKIIFWSAVVIIGLFVITGLFSLAAGLSATTIIIILLVLIWLK